MQDYVDVRGGSGATYRFRAAPFDKPMPSIAGVFLYARGEGGGFTVVYAGQADMLQSCLSDWDVARREHGAEAVYVRLGVSAALRHSELEDILAVLNPPMNAG